MFVKKSAKGLFIYIVIRPGIAWLNDTETSVPGIFASGDVRFGALTGISSAVGEGAMAIRFVRKYLQEM